MTKLKRSLSGVMFFLKPAWKNGKLYFLLLLFQQTVPGTITSVVTVLLPKVAIDGMLQGKSFAFIVGRVAGLCAVLVAVNLIQVFTAQFSNIESTKNSYLRQTEIFLQAVKTDYKFLDSAEYFQKFQLAVNQYANGSLNVISNIASLIGNITRIGALFAITASIGSWVIVISVIPVIIQALLQIRLQKLSLDYTKEQVEVYRTQSYWTTMMYRREYAADMKATQLSKSMIRGMGAGIDAMVGLIRRYLRKQVGVSLIQTFVNQAGQLAVIAYVVWGISHGKIGSVGDYAALIAASSQISAGVQMLLQSFTQFAGTAMQAEQVREFFELPSEIEPSSGAEPPEGPLAVSLHSVDFSYAEDAPILRDVSLTIKPGEKIAIVGENGAGKTTLMKLLLRLYDVNGGEIRYNGQPIRSLDVHKMREKIGVAFQDSNIFAISLRDNLRFYHPGADDGAMLSALERVGLSRLDDLDRRLTREFDNEDPSYVYINGVIKQLNDAAAGYMLSGGEMQKLALARLLTGDFGLLILDEPSASLDPLAEYNMTKLMFEASNTTTIMVAHRLGTVRDADRIYLISDGGIAESGTHDELIARGGKYAEMFAKQSENYLK
ncbi:MAG: ABC transporter ATP-binding protein/permease [Oscillospiraceae bacterium]|jgi:ATP-binding cassette subfamily B protein|nr:ABC transporter ATP-binding protein/permease [Oscillospiraceae bacterium]